MLEVRGLSRGGVLHGISLHVATGEAVGLVGGPGSGKTALLRSLSGLAPCSEGSIRFEGRPLDGMDAAEIVQAGLIHVPQGQRLFLGLTSRDNLLLGATARGRQQRQTTLGQVLELVPFLRDRLDRRAGSLDGLGRAMLAIGRALMARPSMLMLDDPVRDLPHEKADLVLALVAHLHAIGLSVLLAGRELVHVHALANRVCILEHGRLTSETRNGSSSGDRQDHH